MYLLGVDGGSTKIDFLVTDLHGNPVFEYRLYKPSNLKYVGPDNVIKNLEEGFKQIKKTGVNFSDIKFAYLGIAECGKNSGIIGRDEVYNFLTKELHRFELADDQFSVFYSNSRTKNGVLANAGTGSNLNRFYNGQEKTYKSLGHGGRDFGKMILVQIKYEAIKKDSLIYKYVTKFLQQDPVEFYNNLNYIDTVINPKMTQIPGFLSKQIEKYNDLAIELDTLLVLIAGRWGSKISSYCYANFNYKPEDDFDIVLTGGMWNWQRIKTIAIDEIHKVFPKANILYNPETKPVVGCIKLAMEMV